MADHEINERSVKEAAEEFVKKRRVFILGAGFSAAAGIPLTAPLLGKVMRKFERECPGLFARVDNHARECFSVPGDTPINYPEKNFSDLCTFLEFIELREYGGGERWSDAGSRENLAFKFYISKTIAEHTPVGSDIPDLYLAFAAQLRAGDIVISFNWDCVLELALRQVGKAYSYDFKRETIWLCKLHGSVNWRHSTPNRFGTPVNTLGWQKLGLTSGAVTKNFFYSDRLLSGAGWNGHEPLGEIEPLLVLPGYGKAFTVRDIAMLWYKPEFAFATTHDVFIIGLSLAPDDFFIRSFFLSNLPYIESYSGVLGRRIYIINPDPAVVENYSFVARREFVSLLREPFSVSHIDIMRSDKA